MPSSPKKTAPISKEIQKRSLDALMALYSKELSPEGINRLAAINDLAAKDSVPLDVQSEAVRKLVINEIKKPYAGSSVEQAATAIYSLASQLMNADTRENRRVHGAQGPRFAQTKLYQRSLEDQLQDHDMTQLMPKSHGNIEVLGNVRQGSNDNSAVAVQEGLDLALKKKAIKHIIYSVGPGHWRGVYLTKPIKDGAKYTLELYDPYQKEDDKVKSRAKAIEPLALDMLEKCGIKADQITIKYLGLGKNKKGVEVAQRGFYECGDYTCAFSHYKMQQFGADAKHYNANFIKVLQETGNNNGELRKAMRQASDPSYRPQVPQPAAAAQPKKETSSKPQETEASSVLKTRLEKRVYETATRTSGDKAPLRASFEKEVASLITSRHSIFAKAELAKAKKSALTDEELAAKLQAEEFEKAGFKP